MSDVEPGERESVSVQLRREYRGEDTPSAGNPHSSPATELCGDELFRPPTSCSDGHVTAGDKWCAPPTMWARGWPPD